MEPIAVISGADRGLGLGLCAALLERGWRVIAGQYMPDWPELSELGQRFPGLLHPLPLDAGSIDSVLAAARWVGERFDHLDLLVSNAGVRGETQDIRDFSAGVNSGLNYSVMQSTYNINALGALRMVEAFLPLISRGALKRLCFVSSEAGSINAAWRKASFGYCMSKTALNMAVKLLHNQLHPQGYSLRLYHPGYLRTYMGGEKNTQALFEPAEAAQKALAVFLPDREDEGRLVMLDYLGREWPY